MTFLHLMTQISKLNSTTLANAVEMSPGIAQLISKRVILEYGVSWMCWLWSHSPNGAMPFGWVVKS